MGTRAAPSSGRVGLGSPWLGMARGQVMGWGAVLEMIGEKREKGGKWYGPPSVRQAGGAMLGQWVSRKRSVGVVEAWPMPWGAGTS